MRVTQEQVQGLPNPCTAAQMARTLGVRRGTLLAWLRSGQFPARKLGRDWAIDPAAWVGRALPVRGQRPVIPIAVVREIIRARRGGRTMAEVRGQYPEYAYQNIYSVFHKRRRLPLQHAIESELDREEHEHDG